MHTPEQIEKWAREAGLASTASHTYPAGVLFWTGWSADLTRFAALVAQHERERCAQIADRESTGNMADGQIIAAAIRNSDGG